MPSPYPPHSYPYPDHGHEEIDKIVVVLVSFQRRLRWLGIVVFITAGAAFGGPIVAAILR